MAVVSFLLVVFRFISLLMRFDFAAEPVNSEAFVGQNARSVRPEDQFFLKYFREKIVREGAERAEHEKQAGGRLSALDDKDDAFDDEEAFAQEVAEKFMQHHARTTAGGIDPDEDPDFFDDDGDDGKCRRMLLLLLSPYVAVSGGPGMGSCVGAYSFRALQSWFVFRH